MHTFDTPYDVKSTDGKLLFGPVKTQRCFNWADYKMMNEDVTPLVSNIYVVGLFG